MVKNSPAMQETQVQSLGWEYSLENGMATHSSILAWRIPWTEEPGGLESIRSQRDMTNTFASFHIYPSFYSALCWENQEEWAGHHFLPGPCQATQGTYWGQQDSSCDAAFFPITLPCLPPASRA